MKRNEILFASLSQVKEDYILESGQDPGDTRALPPAAKKENRKGRFPWAALAAVLLLFVLAGLKLLLREGDSQPGKLPPLPTPSSPASAALTESEPGPDDLPLLAVPAITSSAGFEGYLAYGAEELVNGNPWTRDVQLKSLPVFRNRAPLDRAGAPLSGVNGKDLLEQAEAIASRMGLTVVNSYVEYWGDNEEGTAGQNQTTAIQAYAECEGVTIEVDHGATVTIWLDPPMDLPEGFVFTNSSSREEAESALTYLFDGFSSLLEIKEPALDLFADYDIYGKRHVRYVVYENRGELKDRILAYSFDYAVFSPDEEGRLWIIRRYLYDLSDAIGEYPIISVAEAEKLLMEGHYVTTYPQGLPGGSQVFKVDLIYRTAGTDEIFMPYYRFLIELPDHQQQNTLKTFGAFYVPAVQQKYISNMPLWDGSMN